MKLLRKKTLREPLHLIGIGGSGMAPLALIANGWGYNVQGSDTESSYFTELLIKQKITVFPQQSATNLQKVGTVIVSSAIKEDNPELLAARQNNCDILHRSDLLNHFLSAFRSITVSGTHGKSTTSAMIAYMLESMDLKPTAAIGGLLLKYNSPALLGFNDLMVAEADESDGTFLKYRPDIAVLTSVDYDHLDHYKTFDELLSANLQYLHHLKPEGKAIINWDDKGSHEVGGQFEGDRLTYGFRLGSDIRGLSLKSYHDHIIFDAMVERDRVTCKIPVIGQHNANNALAALAIARAMGLNVKQAASALVDFPGVKRRLSLIYSSSMIRVYDDYAHNPGKIMACLLGLRHAFPDFNIHVFYQPHRYSRLVTMYDEFTRSFLSCDRLTVLPVFAAGEPIDSGFSLSAFCESIQENVSYPVDWASSFRECLDKLDSTPAKPSVYLTLGAGDVWKLSEQIRDFYEKEQKNE